MRNLSLSLYALMFLACTLLHSGTVLVSAFSPACSANNKMLCSKLGSCGPRLLVTSICNTKSNSDGEGKFTATPIKPTTPNPNKPDPKTKIKRRASDRVNSPTLQFNNRLNRMSKNFDATTAPKVEALLLEAVRNYQQAEAEESQGGKKVNKKQMIIPNTVSFTNSITAWARCTRKDSAKHAQTLLDQMHALHKERGWNHVKPNKISYNSVITAWARSRERGSARQAEELLRSMYEFYNKEKEESESDNGGVGADGSGGSSNNNMVDLKPDSRSWNAVINAVARSRDKDCANRAKFLLDEMGRLYNEGDSDLLPDALTFGAIINAYANSFEEGASDKAAQLLMHMESLSGLGFEKAKPTTFVYNACMNAFAKDPLTGTASNNNNAMQAEQLLTSMEKRYGEEKDHRVMPDCISYSTVINAYANSNTAQSGICADAILRRMTNRYLLGDTKCRPNAVAFTAAIKAHSTAINATLSSSVGEDESMLSQSNNDLQHDKQHQRMEASARRCEDLLQQLCLLYQNHGNDWTLKPTSVTFELVIKALAQVEDRNGVERVELLREAIC